MADPLGPIEVDFAELKRTAEACKGQGVLEWRDWARYSGRQQRRMKLGGVTGSYEISGDLAPFAPFLRAGELIHLGKNATLGLGAYRIVSSE